MGDLLKTKTFWTGIAFIGFGIFQVVTGEPQDGIQNIGVGLGMIFVRDAVRTAIK